MAGLQKACGLLLTAGLIIGTAAAQSSDSGAKQNMKNAGHETVAAGRDTGRAVKQGTRKGYRKTKRGTKKAAHKVHHAVDPDSSSTTATPRPQS